MQTLCKISSTEEIRIRRHFKARYWARAIVAYVEACWLMPALNSLNVCQALSLRPYVTRAMRWMVRNGCPICTSLIGCPADWTCREDAA